MRIPEDVRQRLREIYAQVPGKLFPQIVDHLRALDAAPAELAHHRPDVLFCRHVYMFSLPDGTTTHDFAVAIRTRTGEWEVVDIGYMVESEE